MTASQKHYDDHPGTLAAYWFVFGFWEFCAYGLIAAWLYPLEGGQEKARARSL